MWRNYRNWLENYSSSSARPVVIWQFRSKKVTWAGWPPSELNWGAAFWIRPVIKAGPRHAGAPGRLMTWRPFNRLGQHFWERVPNSFTCGNLSLLATYFILMQWRLSAPSRCPVGPPIIIPLLELLLFLYVIYFKNNYSLWYVNWTYAGADTWKIMFRIYFKCLNNSKRIWCDFDRASSLICGNKIPTRCNLSKPASCKPDT